MQWMLFVILISIVVGWVRGGKLRNLTEIRVRLWSLLPLGFILLAASSVVPADSHKLAIGLILVSYLPLLLFLWLNREMTGMWGSSDLVLGAKHVLLTEDTVVPFLADIIPLPSAVLSLGDVFLAIGIGAFLEDQMRRPLSLFAHRVAAEPGSAAE